MITFESFLNDNSIKMSEFLRNMDRSQARYSDVEDFLQKFSPNEWIAYAFCWTDNTIQSDGAFFAKLCSEWDDLIKNIPTEEIFFFNHKKKAEPLKIYFE